MPLSAPSAIFFWVVSAIGNSFAGGQARIFLMSLVWCQLERMSA
jgi:hypothetical protein